MPEYGFFMCYSKSGYDCVPFKEGSPLPKLEIDRTTPTLSDMCNDQHKINLAFIDQKSISYMFIVLMVDCKTLGDKISGVSSIERYSDKTFYHNHEQEFFQFVFERLKYVFQKDRNSQWVDNMAHIVIATMQKENSCFFGIDFIDKHMTPFIQRNYCTTDDAEDPKDRKYVTVGAMYGKLHTFLCGTKRKRSPVSRLNSDIIAKIFDHMQITAYPDVKWNSFGTKRLTA